MKKNRPDNSAQAPQIDRLAVPIGDLAARWWLSTNLPQDIPLPDPSNTRETSRESVSPRPKPAHRR